MVTERTSLPCTTPSRWAGTDDFRAAGIAIGAWNRDLGAGGVTEYGKAGAKLEERSKVSSHVDERTWARSTTATHFKAHLRVAKARKR